ncbi:MAG: SMP-30/gluconolactonase/LRE family protein [Burkholderiales bacterium]
MTMNFEKIAGPYQGLTGGVTWDGTHVLFSAVKEERILRFNPKTGATDNFRRWTGRTNGIAIGKDGATYGAQEGGRRVIQFMADGSTAPTAEMIDGWHHNQPTDLTVDSKGRVWFADSRSDTLPYGPAIFPFMEINAVMRLERDERRSWKVVRVTSDTKAPRAVVLSADEKTLYVADGDSTKNDACTLRAYSVNAEGSVGPARVLHTFALGERGFEGLCLDSGGNIVACGGSKQKGVGPQVVVFAPSGAVIESHAAPDLPMRCAFGDEGLGSLYLTSGDGNLYRAKNTGHSGLKR